LIDEQKQNRTATAVYIPATLLGLLEEARVKLGMNRSKFIQYCILRTLQDLSMLSKAVHADDVLVSAQKEEPENE